MKTPNAINKVSKEARHILTLSNLALLGITININDLSAEEAFFIEYYGMRRRNMEEQSRFKALFTNLGKMFGK